MMSLVTVKSESLSCRRGPAWPSGTVTGGPAWPSGTVTGGQWTVRHGTACQCRVTRRRDGAAAARPTSGQAVTDSSSSIRKGPDAEGHQEP
jgi:hypothetical protein